MEGSKQMEEEKFISVCVAVELEARPLRRQFKDFHRLQLLVTGMGPGKARQAITRALGGEQPDLVLTCGLAGGLNPALAVGEVVFDADPDCALTPFLLTAGAKPARFHGVERVIASAADKQKWRDATSADVVDMESHVIRMICRERGIPSAAVRIISDSATEDLPLDFNHFLNRDQAVAPGKVAWHIVRHPGKLGALLRFQQQCQRCAHALACFLAEVLKKYHPT